MAESIIFRGAWIRYFDGRHDEGGAFIRIHMTSEFTQPVINNMGWDDPGHSVSSANLEGEILATHLILTPGDDKLGGHQIQFDIKSIEDFKVVTVEKDEVRRRELRFVVGSSSPDVAALVDNYIRRIGEHQGALKVSYTKQEELPLEEKTAAARAGRLERDTGCTSCNNGLAFADDTRTKHLNGVPCTARGGEPVPVEIPPAAKKTRGSRTAVVG